MRFDRVASYTYNAWGEHTVTNYTSANIGNINPFRYRGYYFDTETGFYYVGGRYYDPMIRRYINAKTPNSGNPNSIVWEELGYVDKYDSRIIYFAISR